MAISGDPPGRLAYPPADFSLRAPRVAVIFDGGQDWQFWALSAMRDVTRVWGGSGFVLVPHHGGEVTSTLISAVRAYDPDFVTVAPRRLGMLDVLAQGTLQRRMKCTAEEAAEALRNSGEQILQDPAARAAEDQLSRWCSPYRRLHDGSWDRDAFSLTSTRHLMRHPETAGPGDESPCLALPGGWRGPTALAAAVHLGVLEELHTPGTQISDDAAGDLLGHLWNPGLGDRLPPEIVFSSAGVHLPGFDPTNLNLHTALQATEKNLAWVYSKPSVYSSMRFIVGDSADDFALAMILHRLHRYTFWMHPTWSPSHLNPISRAALEAGRSWLSSSRKRLLIGSTTLTQQDVQPWVDALRKPDTGVRFGDGGGTMRPLQVDPSRVDYWPLPVADHLRGPMFHLASPDQFDLQITVPALTGPDGAIEIAATLPLPLPPAGAPVDRPYQVDFALAGAHLPTGRGFDAHTLLAEEENHRTTRVRSGRDGVSYQARRFDFILAGASVHRQLATPRFRLPSLRGWVEQMASQAGYQVVSSDAGHKTDLLTSLWGSRDAVTAALTGPIRQVLETIAKPPSGSRDSYLCGEAIRLPAEHRGVITFDGIRWHWPADTSTGVVRKLVDQLTVTGVLRRGMVLRCPACTLLDFIALDNLHQTSTCRRCGGAIPLTQEAWKKPEEEPRWFYDANPLAASLITTRSDVPFLLAAHLSGSAREYTDIGEIELRRDGKSCAEIDLIALADDRLIVGEAKSSNTLGNGRARRTSINGRLLAAQALHADEVVFATTQPEWSQSVAQAVRDAAHAYPWSNMPRPAVRMVARLAGEVTDTPA